MDTLLFHPKVVHFPMALAVLMPLVAGGLACAWWRKWLPGRVWFIAVSLQAILLTSGAVALHTGESEEERVESFVSERLIEAHEEAAERFVWGSGAVLAIMLAAAALGRRRSGLPIAFAATLGTLIVLGLGCRTGRGGGSLVYEQGAARAYTQAAPDTQRAARARRHHHEDDD